MENTRWLSPSPAWPTRIRLMRWIRLRAAALSIALAALVALAGLRDLDPRPVSSDSGYILAVAHNLATRAAFSDERRADRDADPTMLREPLPPLLYAVWLRAAFPGLDAYDYATINSEAWIGRVKAANHLFVALTAVLLFHLVVRLLGLPLLALAIQLAFHLMVLGARGSVLTALSIDPPAMLLMALLMVAFAHAWPAPRWRGWLLPGFVLGLAALTKAVLFYAIPALGLVLWACLRRDGRDWRGAVEPAVTMAVVALVTCLPWMIRNAAEFGEFKISGRGGVVLYLRTMFDGMTAEEYRGSFYAFAPNAVRPLVGWVSGHGPADVAWGGSLQRLNYNDPQVEAADIAAIRAGDPSAAVSLYRRRDAERFRLLHLPEIVALGRYEKRYRAVDNLMEKAAWGRIREAPLRHMAVSLPLAWQGFWTPAVPVAFAPLMWAAFVGAMVAGWRRRCAVVPLLLAPGALMLLLYALLSHFEARYSNPVVPPAMLALAYVIALLARFRIRRPALAVPAPAAAPAVAPSALPA